MSKVEEALTNAIDDEDWDKAKKIADLIKSLNEAGVGLRPVILDKVAPAPKITALRLHPSEGGSGVIPDPAGRTGAAKGQYL
jgi:hypothetical protein